MTDIRMLLFTAATGHRGNLMTAEKRGRNVILITPKHLIRSLEGLGILPPFAIHSRAE
jgi:hypothetical protein